mmetsp:Transcript_79656/g.234316  ORF Transcript_79656/g.234316 Transcript_79656/m.234316 type:complete len:209 (-) Transcript_79656:44-670(-)
MQVPTPHEGLVGPLLLFVRAPLEDDHLRSRAHLVDGEEHPREAVEGHGVHAAPREGVREVRGLVPLPEDVAVKPLPLQDVVAVPHVRLPPPVVQDARPHEENHLLTVVRVVQAQVVQGAHHGPGPTLRDCSHKHFDASLVIPQRRVLALDVWIVKPVGGDVEVDPPTCTVVPCQRDQKHPALPREPVKGNPTEGPHRSATFPSRVQKC